MVLSVSFSPGLEAASSRDSQTKTTNSAAFQAQLSAQSTRLVAAARTPLTSAEASTALRKAWREVLGEEPSEPTVALLTAQWAHETGSGRSMYNYNFGGIKGTGPTGLSVSQRTREGYGATERQIVDRFRAYESAEQGATDYVKLLAGHYRAAINAAKQGDATGFVQGLKAGGYFTGDPVAYTRSVTSLAKQVLGGNLPTSALASSSKTLLQEKPIASSSASALDSNTVLGRLESSRLAMAWLSPLTPRALMESSEDSEPEATGGSLRDDLAASDTGTSGSALLQSMSDEVARASLQALLDDGRRRLVASSSTGEAVVNSAKRD